MGSKVKCWRTHGLLELGTGMKVGLRSTVSVRDDVWLHGEGPYKIQSPRVSDIVKVV